jgi:hypothetical protein
MAMKILLRWKQTALHNKALVLTSVLVAVGTLFYTGAAIFQYNLMKQTAKEQYSLMEQTAKENSEQTDKLIAEAKSIASAAKENLEQSKQAIDASIEISRRDQRAWVGITEIIPPWRDPANNPLYIKEGSNFGASVTIINSGKTPALNIRSKIRLMAFPRNHKFAPDYGNVQGQSVGVLQPQGKFKATSLPSYQPVNASDITSLKNSAMILYLYGEIQYEDIFKISHRTTYCSFLAQTLDSFVVNSTYNDAN